MCESEACSQGSADSTTASRELGSSMCSCANQTSGGEGCCGSGSPECPSTTTLGMWRLTEAEKQEATRLYETGLSCGKVAERFGVSRQAMWDVLRRRTTMRDRIAALPRQPETAKRRKRKEALRRYRSRAARITRAQERAVRARDRVCVMCGADGTDIDHVTPVAAGGQTEMENLQLLCEPCHIAKSRADWREGVVPRKPSTSWSEASHDCAKTSASPANDEDSQATAPASSSSSPESSTLFDPDGFSSRTYPDSSVRTAVGTSESCLERWPTSGMGWLGGFSTAVSSECRSDEDGCSSSEPALSEILEPPQSVPARYLLSARAAQGILRRAEKRGKALPSHLRTALEAVSQEPSEVSATAALEPPTLTVTERM